MSEETKNAEVNESKEFELNFTAFAEATQKALEAIADEQKSIKSQIDETKAQNAKTYSDYLENITKVTLGQSQKIEANNQGADFDSWIDNFITRGGIE